MRLFVALELPRRVVTELEALQQRLRRTGKHPVKWVASTGMHLTLVFLGEVGDDQVSTLLVALNGITYTRLPQLQLAAVGAFPNVSHPQVLWVGVGGDLATLHQIQTTVLTTITQTIAFEPEKRPYHPHLTLGRVRRDAKSPQLVALSSALTALPLSASDEWETEPPVLFQSTLTPDGPVYIKLT